MLSLLVSDLENHVAGLRGRFLAPFLPTDPAHRPQDYDHDVKAACVLAHAAFEEFVEQVSLHVMSKSLEKWQKDRHANNAVLALCLCHGVGISVQENEDITQATCFDQLRLALDEAKKRHSKSINENHGFSIKYLRSALTPVFINPPDDVRLTQSLKTLTAARGSFAHSAARNAEFTQSNKTARIKSSLSPESASDAIADCVLLCKEIARDASKFTETNDSPQKKHESFARRLLRKSIKSVGSHPAAR